MVSLHEFVELAEVNCFKSKNEMTKITQRLYAAFWFKKYFKFLN